jgi:hypothetical protein
VVLGDRPGELGVGVGEQLRPLTAPTPSKVRPPDAPLIVIAVSALAGSTDPSTTPTVASTQQVISNAEPGQRRRRR